jgi:hypothetical protein
MALQAQAAHRAAPQAALQVVLTDLQNLHVDHHHHRAVEAVLPHHLPAHQVLLDLQMMTMILQPMAPVLRPAHPHQMRPHLQVAIPIIAVDQFHAVTTLTIGLAFHTMTLKYLASLTLWFPRINLTALL